MLKELFDNKKFIFIFTFIVEFIFYYIFEFIEIGGSYIIPDIGLAPIFGLMFGPAGALGQACASFTWQLYEGYNIFCAGSDFFIMFFISIFTYKLWYSTFKRDEITSPRFDSLYNLLKFVIIILVSSVVYWAFINIFLEVYSPFYVIYPLTTPLSVLSYILDMFNFSLIYGLLLISVFNILEIPLKTPKKWFSFIDIDYSYFTPIFVIMLIYALLTANSLDNDMFDMIFFIITIVAALLFCLNKLDSSIIKDKIVNYSIVEEIILIFLFILAITFFALFDDLSIFTYAFLKDFNTGYLIMITLFYGIILFIVVSAIHLYFVEDNITNPLYGLIDAIRRYGKEDQEDIEVKFKSKFNKQLNGTDDMSMLVKSFVSLNQNIESNLYQIEKTTAEKEKIETEFKIASNIQSNMLKTNFDEFSEGQQFEIYGFMNPAREVGGDFYDFFRIDDDNIAFLIGDVSGKGVPATLFMVKTMYLIRNHSKFSFKPNELYENVNNSISQRNKGDLFVTSLFGKLNLRDGKLTFVNAGHNQPLVRRNSSGDDFDYFDVEPNFVLGIMEEMPYEEQELELNPGDIVFLYTDGITEANNDYQGFYGEDRLKETINKYKDESLETIVEKIKSDIYDFCNSEEQFDDMTMLIIKYGGENNG
ncbi:hypothetical protein TL18_00065 [Methanobrevibacter sp. YE315]|uniref:PP2C family protein-serine/threonine phosphatase n=1 Tax=Methanobrevibacter sp. YE315 TaxID=1609968 RepID=UPI000764EF36|nr:SpoIIE family protein phosphatase [Methanobrevibacter sp. YE315]AMD16567.1 hypothetical protein TL18_00065 [Methanobrevibacter sp. YE315]